MIIEVTFCTAIAVSAFVAKKREAPLPGHHGSVVVHYCGNEGSLSQIHLRNTFTNTPSVVLRPVKGAHSHATAAAERSAGTATLHAIARSCGYEPYSYQMSAAEQRLGLEGGRSYYWAKDLTTTPRAYAPDEHHIVTIVDTDHYVDMNSLLATQPRPYLIRTLQPKSVARNDGDTSYTFNEEDEVIFKVSGSGSFRHRVWNYQQDHVTAFKWKYYVWPTFASYLIERRPNGRDHELVLLAPLRNWSGPSALFARWWLENKPLMRMEPNHNGFLFLHVKSNSRHDVSVGRPGEFASTDLPVASYEAVVNVSRALKNPITMPSIESLLPSGFDRGQVKLASAVLTMLARDQTGPKPPFVFPVEDGVRAYQLTTYVEEPKVPLKPFMAPLVHGAYSPCLTKANEEAAIEGRVALPQASLPKPTPPTPFLHRIINEFVELVVPEQRVGHPMTMDDLLERQDKATQRKLIELGEAGYWTDPNQVKTFLKNEAMQGAKDPRVISTIAATTKLWYSKFIYAVSEGTAKGKPWYAFSMPPKEVAERMAAIASISADISCSDFTKMDGHVDSTMREIEKRILLAYFHPMWHDVIIELHAKVYNQRATCSMGTKYDTLFSRLSGETGTSFWNTLQNLFIHYLARRMSRKVDGEYWSMSEVWQWINEQVIVGGDDGASGDCPDTMVRAASSMGHKLKEDRIPRGSPGVNFLARIFGPNVWYGDTSSMCDLARQLAKFHTSPNLAQDITCEDKLIAKAHSFALTDAQTPVIGQLAMAVVRIAGAERVAQVGGNAQLEALSRWWDRYDEDVQFPNDVSSWSQGELQRQLPGFAEGVFERWLDSAERSGSVTAFLHPPVCMEPLLPEPTRLTVVDNEETLHPPVLVRQVAKGADSRASTAKKAPRKKEGPPKKGARRARPTGA